MTFDETIEKFEQEANEYNGLVPMETIYELILDLKEEYAPTIEMTKQQRDIIIGLLDESDISRDDWNNMINDDSPELPKISYRQAIMAYMNPETIKAVYE